MKQKSIQQGFTLIELLVVVAIIGLLAGLIFPAVTGVLKKSKSATAQTEVKSIESALNAFFSDYGRFPKDNGSSDKTYGGSSGNGDIIKALRGLDNTLNPRRINYLEVAEKSLNGDNMINPWGSNYFIAVNTDFNNILVNSVSNLSARNIAVWTYDADGNLLKSW